MIPIPIPEEYKVSTMNGFLPTEAPLDRLPNPYYEPWEYIMKNLQGLILSKRLRETVDKMPVLSTEHLSGEAEWRRAYSALAFITHAYIWGSDKPAERVPPPVTIPFLQTCRNLELPSVATYAGLVLWNWKPIFDSERTDSLANLDMIDTFTGSLDEKWFYLISVAIESRAGPLIPLMLKAVDAANHYDKETVTECLELFAERIDELGMTLSRMYENCDPHVFYHRIRPFLAGSKNMAAAGLPNGVIFDNGGPINKQRYVQLSGGSNAQSSILQFFDIVLDIKHTHTGETPSSQPGNKKHLSPAPSFIHEQRQYMPGPHARFLRKVEGVANIRAFVAEHSDDQPLKTAFDACIVVLSNFRDRHLQMVTRYIIIKSAEVKRAEKEKGDVPQSRKINLAMHVKDEKNPDKKKDLTGTGGTALIPFLRQARDETNDPAVEAWTRRILNKRRGTVPKGEGAEGEVRQGISTVWTMNTGSALCYS